MKISILIYFWMIVLKLICLDISSQITTTEGVPIDNVIVTADELTVSTDEKGYFKLTEISQHSLIYFHKIGYQDRVLKPNDIKDEIILESKSISIEGYSVIEDRTRILINSDELIINNSSEANSVADVLREVTGLKLAGTPLMGEEQALIFPGYEARHTLVMVDGVPLNSSGNSFDLSTIPAAIIESIEIEKGNTSSIGGSGAMGGIININTKRSTNKYMFRVEHSTGSFGLDRHSISFSRMTTKFSFFSFFRKSFANNDFKYIPNDDPDTLRSRENNEKSIYDANIKLGFNGSFGEVSYNLLFQDFFKKLPGNIESLEWYKNSRISGQSQKHILKYSRSQANYRVISDLFFTLDESIYDNTYLDPPWSDNIYLATKAKNEQLSRGLKVHSEYLSDIFFFDWGGDYKFEDFVYTDLVHPEQSIDKVIRENYGIFGSTLLKQDYFPYNMSLAASTRWETTTGFQDNTSWKIAPEFAYENYFIISFGGNVANGFTLPSYHSLFWKGDSHVSGNPYLEPESSLSWQLFSKLKFAENHIQVSYRHDDIKDKIIWIRDEWSKWKPTNLAAAEVKNWNLVVVLNPVDFAEISADYTINSAINRTHDDPNYGNVLIYIPDKIVNLKLETKYKQLNGIVTYKYIGEQWANPAQLTEEHKISSFDLINVKLNYSITWKQFELTPEIKVNNIFNRLYDIYDHVPQPGINWEVNLSLQYKI
ncbi:MAG: TonB-dependent receptor plug domain-containing protein [Candidatus Cloacimonetes bacterium]|nr:TonB-dependent receptor plug domain-containing protein [Candidatus Cloacimonadota bacterium]